MVKLPDPGYPTAGEGSAARNDYFILAALARKESNETDTIAFVDQLVESFIPLPVQS